jgi:hypothetical protein
MITIPFQKLEIVHKDYPLQIDYFLRPGEKETVYIHSSGCSKNDFIYTHVSNKYIRKLKSPLDRLVEKERGSDVSG